MKMRIAIALVLVVVTGALLAGLAGGETTRLNVDPAWLKSGSWDDGKAVVSVFRGRIKWYGEWRDAEVRHYLVREYMHPKQRVKQEPPAEDSIPVLKANVLISFETGTYPYRQMCSMFFDRGTGALVKAVGSSQEGCGASFQRWDGTNQRLTYDTYWANEGAGSRELDKRGTRLFVDELPILAGSLRPGRVQLLPSLMLSSVRDRSVSDANVTREGDVVEIGARRYRLDQEGFLDGWTVPGQEEFRRVAKKRLYYWQHSGNGDEKLLEAK
jgi:hypothetical protein